MAGFHFDVGESVRITGDSIHKTTLGAIALGIAREQSSEIVGEILAQESRGVFSVRFSYQEPDGRETKSSALFHWYDLDEM